MRVLFCIALLLVVKGAIIVTCPKNGYGCVTYGANIVIQTTRTNSLCRNGYYWNNQACMPCKNADQVVGGYYTCSAYYEGTSLTCISGYTLINGVCVQIPLGCTAYGLNQNSDAYVCTACTSDYTLKAGVCINNRYCSSWDDNAVCTSCQTGYFLNWDLKFATISANLNNQSDWINTWQTYYKFPGESFCSVCSQTMANCKSCNSAYTCSQCNDGYYWQQSISSTQLTSSNAQFAGSCVSCLTSGNCSTCQGSSCTQCKTGYYPTKDTTNTVILSCNLCPNGCSTCTSSTFCTDCYASFYKYTDNLCYPLNKCASINTQLTTIPTTPKCSSCIAGYALDPSGTGICYQCGNCDSCTIPSGQQTASLQTSCTTCWDTYYGIKDTNGIVTCKPCTQASDSFLRCQGPVENSSLTGVVPTQCQDGYYLYTLPASGTTQAQVVCVPSNQTQQCVTIVATSATQYTCATCTIQTKLYTNSQCLACDAGLTNTLPQGCTACTGSPTNSIACSACAVNYYFSTGTTTTCTACDVNCLQCAAGPTCTKCAITYYVSGGGCTQCGVANCATCNAQTPSSCQVCLDGYFLSSINTGTATTSYCLKCPFECATCSAPGQVCNSCISGYVLQNGGCVTLSSANCAEGYTTSTLTNQQYPTTQNGCAICKYGFYNFEKRCLQSVQPYAGAVYVQKNIGIGSNPGVSNYETIIYSIFLVLMLLGY
ncbi:unnamed protein product [Paramecium pentaurelia]|uniref:Uncharacterized protein n=1 Tax=Paramecium pentaurelia TaxID=43138 RepID=A0A8S1X3W2_9CILI|nr:unnamed protein product [Paramecium pentaurelia]